MLRLIWILIEDSFFVTSEELLLHVACIDHLTALVPVVRIELVWGGGADRAMLGSNLEVCGVEVALQAAWWHFSLRVGHPALVFVEFGDHFVEARECDVHVLL